MTVRDDVKTLRDFLSRQGSTEAAWKALDRLEETLPKKTAGEQFREFPIGQAFTTANPNTFTFVKVSETGATRIHRSTGKVSYYRDLLGADHFDWDDPNVRALIPTEEYGY